tara:strand:- start:515 stop:1828 length:1314 start_codon:yes stop_codon:yes gene_type:complete
MATIIEMPKLSDTMSVGTLVKWHKVVGDAVANGDTLAEIETDKATMELENFDDGVLLKIFVSEGSEAPIGSPLAVIGEEGEEIPEVSAPPSDQPAENSQEGGEDSQDEPTPETTPASSQDDAGISAPPSPSPSTTKSDGERIIASPLAKKIASEKNIDLSKVTGTGPSGRIVKRDLVDYDESQSSSISQEDVARSSAFSGKPGRIEEKSVPLSKMRSVIAQRLTESKSSIPHFYLQKEINALPLKSARFSINQRLAEHNDEPSKISINDLILFACADAIKWFPGINTSWNENEIKFHGSVNLSFGVAVDDGLVTPVIKNADSLNLESLSIEAKTLIAKARSKKLMPDEMTGSTFTVTNLGMFGIDFFSGIINPPNAAILSVGASIPKPVVDQTGAIVAGETLMLGLSCDHRLIDGAVAAGFLKLLAENLENPASLLV